MQHDDLESILEAFARVDIAEPEYGRGALSTAPLSVRPSALEADGARLEPSVAATALAWQEETPPNPASLRADNRTSVSVVVEAGTVLDGGFSTRATRATVVLSPGAVAAVRVEPLGARWWDEGPVWWDGRLGPVATALLLQITHAEVPVSSSARTALSSLSDGMLVRERPDIGSRATPVLGWALMASGDLLAAWLVHRDPARSGAVMPAILPTGPGSQGATVMAAMRAGLAGGTLFARLVGADDGGHDVVVLRRDLRLVDVVIGDAAPWHISESDRAHTGASNAERRTWL